MPLNVGGFWYLSDLLDREQSFAIQKTLFLGFPQVIAGGRTAHYAAIGWCISRKAVIINRDIFSAGGRQDILMTNGTVYDDLPAVMKKAVTALERPCPVSLSDLSEIYGCAVESAKDAAEVFEGTLISLDSFGDTERALISEGLSRPSARKLIISTLVSRLNLRGFVS